MRDYDWFVNFKDESGVMVRACDKDEAIVLAQAQRIKAGLQWREVVGAKCAGTSRTRHRRRNPLA
jgi:hypothetical protein